MNGAEALIRTLVANDVNVSFANPGTSEMHLVQAIDAVPEMRTILTLFEGVCSGAADGYGRMRGRPACTLLHLGPGLANAAANLHNARRAATPLINIVGNHALYHVAHDAPLTSDIDTLARNFSAWIKSDSTAASLAADGADAVRAAMTVTPGSVGRVASLIVPADACWGDAGDRIGAVADAPAVPRVEDARVAGVAEALDAETLILVGGDGLRPDVLADAARVAQRVGCRVSLVTFPARVDGGAGSPKVERLPYFPEHVLGALQGVRKLVLAGAEVPVSFFAYEQTPSVLLPEGCEVLTLARVEEDIAAAMAALADRVGAAGEEVPVNPLDLPPLPDGPLSTAHAAAIIARLLPEGAIICGDSGGGGAAWGPTQSAAPHSWLNITGGSIGQGGPAAVGAAVACPGRPVLALLGDGAAMYTIQALWTQAREGLDVTTVIYSNRRYSILEVEYRRLGVNQIGERAAGLFDLGNPELSFVDLARGMGVAGRRVETCGDFAAALAEALATPGPCLIEAMV